MRGIEAEEAARHGVPSIRCFQLSGGAIETDNTQARYYTWLDQHHTSGLGENIPMSTAILGDGFVALPAAIR